MLKKTALTFWLLFCGALPLTGCVVHHPAERAAVVVFNDLERNLIIRITLSGKQATEELINSGEFKYIFEYEEDPNEPVKFPQMFTAMQIDVPPGCSVAVGREALADLFVRDPEGRRTWDLHVSESFIKKQGC
ncbi:MAG TPA: hypothetical protein VIM41_05720 [Gammaproteobacteria bacterium]